MSGGPQVTRAFKIFTTANRIPITRRVHALPAVVGSGPKIFGPEEFFSRLINQHRVVSDGTAGIVKEVQGFLISGVFATFCSLKALVVNGEKIMMNEDPVCEQITR